MSVVLPNEWRVIGFGDFALNANGARKPVSLAVRAKIKGDYPYYGATGQIDSLDDFTHEGEHVLIGEDGANLLTKSKDLAFLVKGQFWVNNHAHAIKCVAGVPSEYLQGYINSLNLAPYVTGSAQPKLTKTNLESIRVPVPPLAEQKQIATKLDELLAQVDTLKTRLDTIPTILKRFRQSVLAAAVRGKLTEEWRQDNPSNKTVKKIKDEIREYRHKIWMDAQLEKQKTKGKIPKNDKWKEKYSEPTIISDCDQDVLPEGWVYEPLDGLVYIAARIGWKGLKASEYTQKGPLFLSVHSLNYGQYTNLDKAFHIPEERYNESPEIKLANNDILLCKDGAGIGKIAIVKGLDEPASINSSLLLVRAGKYFETEYLYYFLAGPVMQKLVQERMTGTAVPHLFQRDVKEFVLEVPPINEQVEIVRRVEKFNSFADQIEQRVKDAQKRVNNLTQSILAKAFRGELTADWREQNPDLISGNNSAEALLEKIKEEKDVAEMKIKLTRRSVKKKTGKNMKKDQLICIVEALESAKSPLSAQALLAQSGYPSDASIDEIERFFIEVREKLKLGLITKERLGNEDIFTLV